MVTINSIDSNIPIEISKGGTNAITMATATGLVKYDGTSLVTSATAKLDASNVYSNTAQPALMASKSTNTGAVTGDGTAFLVLFDTVATDQATNYTAGTGKFRTPVAGFYLVNWEIILNNYLAAHTYCNIYITPGIGGNALFNLATTASLGGPPQYVGSACGYIAAATDIYITVLVANGTKVVTVGAGSTFQVVKIC